MTRSLSLLVLSPEKTLVEVADVAWIQAELADGGGIGIWPGHAPLIAETVSAPLYYEDGAGIHTLELQPGILQVRREGVTVLTSGMSEETDRP
jgi:F0F1-type ATP synthase epsilon subunit